MSGDGPCCISAMMRSARATILKAEPALHEDHEPYLEGASCCADDSCRLIARLAFHC